MDRKRYLTRRIANSHSSSRTRLRIAVRLRNGKLVHNAGITATLTLDPGDYTFEAAGTTGTFTLTSAAA